MSKNKDFTPGTDKFFNTLYFKTDEKGKRIGYGIRLEKHLGIFSFETYDKELFKATYWFLKRERPNVEDPLKMEDEWEAMRLLQKFAEENKLSPFVLKN